MKSMLSLVVLLSFAIKSYSQSDTTLPVKIEIRLLKSDTLTLSKKLLAYAIERGQYEVPTDSVKLKHFDIELSIKNTSQYSITIWLMSCSWGDGFEINNDYMHIRGRDCDHNSPEPLIFKGGETKRFKATLVKEIKFDYPCHSCVYGYQVLTTRLGLVVTDVRFTPKLEIFTQNPFHPIDKSEWRVIWSNPLYLFGEQFKPKSFPVYGN